MSDDLQDGIVFVQPRYQVFPKGKALETRLVSVQFSKSLPSSPDLTAPLFFLFGPTSRWRRFDMLFLIWGKKVNNLLTTT